MAHAVLDPQLADKAGSTSKAATTKYVYFFGDSKADGNGRMKDVLGGKGAVRRHVFRAHGIAHDSRRHRPDLPGNYRLCRGPRQIQGRGRGSKRSVLALCGPGVDVYLPPGLFDVGPYIAKP